MKKLSKKIIYVFLVMTLLVASFSNFIFAESLAGYVIDNYDVNIIVNENNTFDITEKIDVNFLEARHGIFRTIPLNNKVYRENGSSNRNRARVTNVNVNDDYKMTLENNNYKIRIGNADTYVTGQKEYTIKYTYNIGKDPNKEFDELYYNIIGDEWDAPIKNYSFTITLPKEFDEQKLGFSTGREGVAGTDGLTYVKEGNVIRGTSIKSLNRNEAVTIRLELPEGYFVNAGHKIGITDVLYFAVPIISLLVAIYIWNKYGKDDEVIETIEFYPPEGLNSLEIGCLYKGKVEDKHITSLLVYLANKGYIKIIEKEKKLFGDSFEIEKIKNYDESNDCERLFLQGLFRDKKEVDGRVTVTVKDLKEKFYTTLNRIRTRAQKFIVQKKIFETATTGKTMIITALVILSAVIMFLIPAMEYGLTESLLGVIFMIFYIILGVFVPLFSNIPITTKIVLLAIFGPASVAIIASHPVTEVIFSETHYISGFIVGIICLILMSILIILMKKRTKYGNEILGKIRGFKTFLETAEKEKLEMMVKENPTYFYDILPYTYVLDVSDKWIEKFEAIHVEEPDWYYSDNGFRVYTFGRFMNSTMSSAQSVMASTPASSGSGSGGGISSGGGFSGGGSGGGGGGSW